MRPAYRLCGGRSVVERACARRPRGGGASGDDCGRPAVCGLRLQHPALHRPDDPDPDSGSTEKARSTSAHPHRDPEPHHPRGQGHLACATALATAKPRLPLAACVTRPLLHLQGPNTLQLRCLFHNTPRLACRGCRVPCSCSSAPKHPAGPQTRPIRCQSGTDSSVPSPSHANPTRLGSRIQGSDK